MISIQINIFTKKATYSTSVYLQGWNGHDFFFFIVMQILENEL